MAAGIWGFLSALPKLIELGEKAWALLVKLSGGDVAGWIKKTAQAFDKLDKADTPEKKKDAAKEIADLIGGM